MFLFLQLKISQKTNSETCYLTLSVLKQTAGFLNCFSNFCLHLSLLSLSHYVFPTEIPVCCCLLFLLKKLKEFNCLYISSDKKNVILPAATTRKYEHNNRSKLCFGFSNPNIQNEIIIQSFTAPLYIKQSSINVSSSLMSRSWISRLISLSYLFFFFLMSGVFYYFSASKTLCSV